METLLNIDDTVFYVTSMALDIAGGKMYWTEEFTHRIRRANLDGTGMQTLVMDSSMTPMGIALDIGAGKMYWTDSQSFNPGVLKRANLNGSAVETLVTGLDDPWAVAIDSEDGKVYWSDSGTNRIQRANLDGSGLENIITTGLSMPTAMAIDTSFSMIYWTDYLDGSVRRALMNGSSVEDILTNLEGPKGLTLDIARGFVYFGDSNRGLFRVNLDGTGIVTLLEDASIDPTAIALDLSLASLDCQPNTIPDECETDCNLNSIPDDCDIAAGMSLDCTDNLIPDECEPDCNGNGSADSCDIGSGMSLDTDGNGIPDECQETLHVPSASYPTIQSALSAAPNGSIVVIADGVYTGTGNKALDFLGKLLTLRSANGPTRCVIDCEKSGHAFQFLGGESEFSVVEGFTITRARSQNSAIRIENGSTPTIRNCVLSSNSGAGGPGGAIHCEEGGVTLINTVLVDNSGTWSGAVFYDECDIKVNHCTISGNRGNYTGSFANFNTKSTLTVTNSILWGNLPANLKTAGAVDIQYTNIEGANPGIGNLDIDPRFAFPGIVNLLHDSPCLDAGSISVGGVLPVTDAEGRPRVLDGNLDGVAAPDMGALERDSEHPAIALDSSYVEVFAKLGTGAPASTIRVRNAGGGVLNWNASESCSWLTVVPSAGMSNGEINDMLLHADTAGLAHGYYDCDVTTSDLGAGNAMRKLQVRLHINQSFTVPSTYSTIQAAMDAATVDGDEVLVSDGIYKGDGNVYLRMFGRRIAVRSQNGPANCIIDCEGTHRGFDFHYGETRRATVDGFTIVNARNVGAIWLTQNSDATILNCVIEYSEMAGIRVSDGSPRIRGCTIRWCLEEGIKINRGFVEIVHCNIEHNYSFLDFTPSGILVDGGGFVDIVNCKVNENYYGIEHWASAGRMRIVNTEILRNQKGIRALGSSPIHVVNATIGRTISNEGIEIFGAVGGPHTVSNSILWQNSGGGPQITGPVTVSYSNVQGGYPGMGNLNLDPKFINANAGDFRLTSTSPCIDAGDNSLVPSDSSDVDEDEDRTELTPRDLFGFDRFVDLLAKPDSGVGSAPIIDMGASEFSDCNGNGLADEIDLSNATSWDCNGNEIPDECDPLCPTCLPQVPLAAPLPFGLKKNRYLSFAHNNCLKPVAFRLTKVGEVSWVGWLSAPDAQNVSKVVNAPVVRRWDNPIVHVGDCEIAPVSAYEVRAFDGQIESTGLVLETIDLPSQNGKAWGDIAGPNNGIEWAHPDAFTNVFDLLALLSYISGASVKPTFQQANLQGISSIDPCLNSQVNTADVLILVKAAAGDLYPFTTQPAACPVCP